MQTLSQVSAADEIPAIVLGNSAPGTNIISSIAKFLTMHGCFSTWMFGLHPPTTYFKKSSKYPSPNIVPPLFSLC